MASECAETAGNETETPEAELAGVVVSDVL
jgi:hypothetical protein